jgi:FecR protein
VFAWSALHPAPHIAERPAPSVTRVETRDAPSHLAVGESSLDVASHSVARIEGSDDTGVNVSLDHGAIDCEVSPRHGRPPFLVRAGDVTVRVVGTHFHVDHEDGRTHVSVQHGAVEVESHGEKTLVAAGSSWPVEHAENVISPEDLPRVQSVQSAQVPPSATVSAPAPVIPSPRERYDRAAALEATHPDEALSIYRELAAGTDSWAMNALYAEARLDLERGNKDGARKRFAEYLQRYPTGPNANDARELSAKLQ